MGLPANPAARGALCCAGLSCIVIIGCSIAVLIINRQELASVTYTCWYVWPYTTCTAYYWGCLASENYDDSTPCNYLYAVGALSLFSSCLSLCFMACGTGGMIGTIIAGAFHVIWWAVAGDYFTDKYNAAHEVPLDNYRHAVMALCWTALSFAAIQFLFGIFGTVSMRGGGRGGDYEDRSDEKPHKHKHEHEHKSHAEMSDQHPPPPMANPYPAPPPPAGAYYPPPPPPAGYPATQPPMAL